jgi:hypothetical protein
MNLITTLQAKFTHQTSDNVFKVAIRATLTLRIVNMTSPPFLSTSLIGILPIVVEYFESVDVKNANDGIASAAGRFLNIDGVVDSLNNAGKHSVIDGLWKHRQNITRS